MTLSQLAARLASGTPAALEIHGFDPMIYVLYVLSGEQSHPICDGRGRPLQYRSRYAAQRALAEAGAREAVFVHRSAYGEMVGLDGSGDETELRERVWLRRE
jgi:hypothetical protein